MSEIRIRPDRPVVSCSWPSTGSLTCLGGGGTSSTSRTIRQSATSPATRTSHRHRRPGPASASPPERRRSARPPKETEDSRRMARERSSRRTSLPVAADRRHRSCCRSLARVSPVFFPAKNPARALRVSHVRGWLLKVARIPQSVSCPHSGYRSRRSCPAWPAARSSPRDTEADGECLRWLLHRPRAKLRDDGRGQLPQLAQQRVVDRRRHELDHDLVRDVVGEVDPCRRAGAEHRRSVEHGIARCVEQQMDDDRLCCRRRLRGEDDHGVAGIDGARIRQELSSSTTLSVRAGSGC